MIERSVYRNALWIITAIALVAAAAFLLMDFTLPKDFADVVPHTQQFDSCKITCTIDGTRLLVPVGMDPCWLNSKITSISIYGVDENGTEIPLSEEQIQFQLYQIMQPVIE